jgi:TMEM175 potassium channel family protein
MSGTLATPNEMLGKSRLESLSDCIFAFAMTLLVISLVDVPVIPRVDAPALLPTFISGMFSEFLIFTIAFFILAGYWLAHHRILRSVEYVDNRLIWVNILLLFFIVLIPFTTSISGDYDNVLEAVLLFHINLLCASVLITLGWLYITEHCGELMCEKEAESELRDRKSGVKLQALAIPAVTVLAIVVSFVNPAMSMLCYLLIPVIMVIAGRFSPQTSKAA